MMVEQSPPIDPAAPAELPPPTLLSELQRRRIPQGVLAYAFVAGGVIHALYAIVPALELPDWVLPAAYAGALAGLPVAVALGWDFDLEPEGVYREHGPEYTGAFGAPNRRARLALVIAVGFVLAIVSFGAWLRLFARG
jgi:hypothetical protein